MEFSDLLKPAVLAYLASILSGQLLIFWLRKIFENRRNKARVKAGLRGNAILDRGQVLLNLRGQSFWETTVLLMTIVVVPFILVAFVFDADSEKDGLAVAFVGMLAWVLFSATDVAKAFFGGVAFRAYASIRCPFQVGDRVTIGGQSGKVEFIGPFFVTLVTVDDDLVNVPTASLWDQTLISANAGDKSSLAVMSFHLAPFVSADLRRKTEQNIWDAIQKSMYWDHEKPMQIYLEQNKDEIVLTAKAYVASTYNEALFKSDVYQSFLDFVDQEKIPLASTEWHRELKP